VLPVYDEAESLRPLHRELDAALAAFADRLELIFVDDGSRDGSAAVLGELAEKDSRVEVIRLPENQGQSAALAAGFRAARGEWIATLDADLQNDPADLPRLLALRGRADVINGVRVKRNDGRSRLLASRVANAIRNAVTGERVSDVGCSLRVMRARHAKRARLFRGGHRFLPTLLRMEGALVIEVPVSHRARRFGRSKYGYGGRLVEGLVDLLAVRWMLSRQLPPGDEEKRKRELPR